MRLSTSCTNAVHAFARRPPHDGDAHIQTVGVLRCAGLQRLAALQRLEVLHVPCDNPHAITHLAAQLPRLRSLDLRCCSAAGLQASTQDLVLTAATRLTALRLRLSTAFPNVMQRLQMPPHLQVNPTWSMDPVD